MDIDYSYMNTNCSNCGTPLIINFDSSQKNTNGRNGYNYGHDEWPEIEVINGNTSNGKLPYMCFLFLERDIDVKNFEYYIACCSKECVKTEKNKKCIMKMLDSINPHEILCADQQYILKNIRYVSTQSKEKNNFELINTKNTKVYNSGSDSDSESDYGGIPKTLSILDLLKMFDLKIIENKNESLLNYTLKMLRLR
jgi:hypothetical protein